MKLFFVCALIFFSEKAQALTFKNFSQSVHLQKVKDQTYQVEGSQLKVKLSNRLIVKTLPSIVKETLRKFDDRILTVTELFKGLHGYYRLELGDGTKLNEVMENLSARSEIKLIQPDLLQLRKKLEHAKAGPFQAPYIQGLKLKSLWQRTKGTGAVVAIIDDGFNLSHPDLKALNVKFSYNTSRQQLDAKPLLNTDVHGTKVAGIIFAQHNQIGIHGIAPEAELIALRQPDTWTSNTLLSLYLAQLAGADIINCSWTSDWLLQPLADVVFELAENGRGGKGIAVVFAAGNEGREILPFSTEASLDQAIVVGARDEYGKRLPFSNYGQSVDLFAYGGPCKTTAASGLYKPFSGTSLAAAVVSGYLALLISENPDIELNVMLSKCYEKMKVTIK